MMPTCRFVIPTDWLAMPTRQIVIPTDRFVMPTRYNGVFTRTSIISEACSEMTACGLLLPAGRFLDTTHLKILPVEYFRLIQQRIAISIHIKQEMQALIGLHII